MEELSCMGFAVIRETDGKEWIDTKTFDVDGDASATIGTKVDWDIPHWAKDNPIKRVAIVVMKVIG